MCMLVVLYSHRRRLLNGSQVMGIALQLDSTRIYTSPVSSLTEWIGGEGRRRSGFSVGQVIAQSH